MSGTDPTIIAQMKAEAANVPRRVTSTAFDQWLNELATETQASGSSDPTNSNVIPALISIPVIQPVVLVPEDPNSMPDQYMAQLILLQSPRFEGKKELQIRFLQRLDHHQETKSNLNATLCMPRMLNWKILLLKLPINQEIG